MESSPNLRLVPGPGGPGTRTAFRVLFGLVFLTKAEYAPLVRDEHAEYFVPAIAENED
jgi:hypothetical protein